MERGCKEKAARFLPADFWAKKRGTAGVVFRSMDSLSGFLCGSCCGQGCLLGFLICRELLLRRLQGESIADNELSVLLAREQLVPLVHSTTYDDLREISPLLASRYGLNTQKI